MASIGLVSTPKKSRVEGLPLTIGRSWEFGIYFASFRLIEYFRLRRIGDRSYFIRPEY